MADVRDVSVDTAKARHWITEVNNELQQVETLLKEVAKASTTIPGEDDPIMKGIETACNKLTDFWNGMVSGFKRTGSLLNEAVDIIEKGGGKVVESISQVISRIGT